MRSGRFVIFAGDRGWKWADGDAVSPPCDELPSANSSPGGSSPESAIASIIQTLRDDLRAGAEITLAIPSHWCFCATIDTVGLPRGSRRQAMLYRLEEKLPVAAEELVADFVTGAGDQSLGVASPLRRLEPLVGALEDGGWVVDAICPTALLAAQAYFEGPDPPVCDALLFAHDNQLELVALVGGRVAEWDVLPAEADDVAVELGLRALRSPPPLRLACAGVPSHVLARLRDIAQLRVTELELPPPNEAALGAIRAAAAGGAAPWVQLRRDALGVVDPYRPARRAMSALVLTAVLLCACTCGALFWRAAGYQRIADQYEHDRGEVFAQVFDGKRPPEGLNIASRLASEERRLRALSGESLDLPSRASALPLLQRMLARVPAEVPCQVSELRINEDKLYIEGTAPSHADAATFAAALSADGAFLVEAPHTEQLTSGGGVAMRVAGIAAAPPPPTPHAVPVKGQVDP